MANARRLNREIYRDKVYGCWTGKAAGGTLGAPYEWSTEMNTVSFYPPEIKGANLPNDDLDLQLVWLAAVERHGALNVQERILAEYWSEMITGPWNEYGVCRNNIRMGLLPPLSGSCGNEVWKWSNGAWIRSEIWACLFPGSPDQAAKAAYADACCDHSGEGIHAEIFTAALESAAFAESDLEKLIETGLSLIPADSRIAAAVRLAMACHRNGDTLVSARKKILESTADLGWFQAPGNIAFAILGVLYGNGDFGKSISYAVNCGDDADCSGGFAGALMGILLGKSRIPKEWTDPVGDEIRTCSIENTGRKCVKRVPQTLTELTDRVVVCAENAALRDPGLVQFTDEGSFLEEPEELVKRKRAVFRSYLASKRPYELTFDRSWGTVSFEFENGPYIESGKPLVIRVRMTLLYSELMLLSVRPKLPDTWSASSPEILLTTHIHTDYAELFIVPGEITEAVTGLPVEVRRNDRVLPEIVVLPLIRSGSVAHTRWTAEMLLKSRGQI